MLKSTFYRCSALLLVLAGVPASSGAIGLIPHQATYALTRERAGPDSGIVGIKGRMEISFTASCDGWRFEQYIGFSMTHENGSTLEHVGRLVGWETSGGEQYWFNTDSYENHKLVEEISGVARLNPSHEPGSVRFAKPNAFVRELPAGTIFPIAHIEQILKLASANRSHSRQMVFDGSALESPFEISTFISAPPPAPLTSLEPLKNAESWLVRLAYYRHDAVNPIPEFEMSSVMYENGIAGDMVYDYGDLAMGLQLQSVELLTVPSCD